MKSGKKVSLIMQILIAMVLGVIVGVIWGKGASCIQFIGTVWLNIIKMFIVPVVICMVVRGVSSLDSPKALGRIGLRVVAFYVITNVFALGIGILTTFVLKPGIGFVFEAMTTETVDTTLPTVSSFVTGLFSTNIFATFSSGDMLQCLVIALLIGVAIVFMGEKGKPVAAWFSNMADLCMALMDLAIIMRLLDVITSIPSTLLSLSIVAALGPGIRNLVIAITVSRVPTFARVIRSAVLNIVNQEYIEAAKAGGTRNLRIMLRHVYPNAMSPIIVQCTMSISQLILQAAGLSFLGMGMQPPAPEWGALLNSARDFMRTAPHLMLFPGIAIVLAALAFNLVGDGLRDAFDPRLKS